MFQVEHYKHEGGAGAAGAFTTYNIRLVLSDWSDC